MGQVFSYVWKWFSQKQKSESRKTLQDGEHRHEKESHYIAIPDVETRYIASWNPNSGIPQVPQPRTAKKKEKQQGHVEVSEKEVVVVVENEDNKKVKVPQEIVDVDEAAAIKRIGQYTSKQKILLVGEGDFSFSASLAVAFGIASNIIATSLNSQEFLIQNYSKFWTNKMEVEKRGGVIIHGIDAKTMFKDLVLGVLKFDRIIFNFPHCGKFTRTDADLRANKELVRGFLRNAKKMVEEDGEIHITHKCNGYFKQWNIPKIGSDQGLTLIQEMNFKRSKYPGYNTKFGFGGDKDFECTPCKTYKFRFYSQ